MTVSVRSMTGFGSTEAEYRGSRYRIEIRSVNHRFLDLKIRLPRDLQTLESSFRVLIQTRVNRGALEVKVERAPGDSSNEKTSQPTLEINTARAQEAFQAYQELARTLKLEEGPSLRDIALFPDVIRTKTLEEETFEASWKSSWEPALSSAVQALLAMRQTEGQHLATLLGDSVQGLKNSIHQISERRKTSLQAYSSKITERVKSLFETYPVPALSALNDPQTSAASSIRSLLESRIAQELALLVDRTDIQEELDRFAAHLTHFEKTLQEGGALGRKLEFILQELGREINTLGNKAQDFSISEQVVAIKVRLEQLREQVLNLE
ncbi:MAG: hypothetical protein RJB38_2203 [Pseudomonadota bacterium]|jgi:uncharacterized protein (TIGR00255 family)